jgi:hypothetical protein
MHNVPELLLLELAVGAWIAKAHAFTEARKISRIRRRPPPTSCITKRRKTTTTIAVFSASARSAASDFHGRSRSRR